jgi:hypothetical protein
MRTDGRYSGSSSRVACLSRLRTWIESGPKVSTSSGVRFHVIVDDEDAEQEENLRLTG